VNSIKAQFRFNADGAIVLLRVNTLIQVAREALVVFFIVQFLTPAEQGIWYTFNSLAFFASLAELGFADMTQQRVSRAFATLTLTGGRLAGDAFRLDSLISGVRHALKTYLAIVTSVMCLLAGIGVFFFGNGPSDVLIVFLCFAVVRGLNLMATLFQAVYQGFDKIAAIEAHTLRSLTASSAALLVGLATGLGLWALVASEVTNLAARIYLLRRDASALWEQVAGHQVAHQFEWTREAVPIQIRFGLNAVGGYLAHNLFVPVVYRLEGAPTAGRLGLTLAMLGAVSKLATAAIKPKVPTLSMLAARGEHDELNRLLKVGAIQMYTAYAFLATAMLTLVYLMHLTGFRQDRLLSPAMTFGAVLYYAVIMIITPWNVYLRAHGDEPWYSVSLLHGGLVAAALVTMIPTYGLLGWVVSVNVIHWAVVLPVGFLLLSRCKARYESGIGHASVSSS